MMEMLAAGLFLLAAFCTDVTRSRIPNPLTAAGAAAGLLLHLASDGAGGLGMSLAGFAAGFLPMLLLYVIGAVAAGDVKLFGALGALTGAAFVLQVMAASLLCAGVIGFVILLVRSDGMQRLKGMLFGLFQLAFFRDPGVLRSSEGSGRHRIKFPFMWAVLPGAVCTLWPELLGMG
ncbi:prepilin peptidase [Paenibacillus sp. S-38]|uniref:prepilin peptidase n=1 Tax=Paenibacillus sp. S-38 TaxID=3416710 RepID=UPI003CE7A1D9